MPPDDRAWMPPAPSGAGDGQGRVGGTTAATGEVLEGYDDLVELARGGDSIVFRARQVRPERDVAVKVLRAKIAELTGDKGAVANPLGPSLCGHRASRAQW